MLALPMDDPTPATGIGGAFTGTAFSIPYVDSTGLLLAEDTTYLTFNDVSKVFSTGAINISQQGWSGGGPAALSVTVSIQTAVPNAERSRVLFDASSSMEFVGDPVNPTTLASQREILFKSPVYKTAGAAAFTITTAATVTITGAPTTAAGGGGTTITNPYALLVQSGVLAVNGDGITTNTTAGLILQNTTAAAAGAQQYSPMFVLTGQGWKTNATAASQACDMAMQIQTIQGAAAPTHLLSWQTRTNGGIWTEVAHLTYGGVLTCTNSMQPSGANAQSFFSSAGGAQVSATYGYDATTAAVLPISKAVALGVQIGPGAVGTTGTPTTALITQAIHTGGTSTILNVTGAAITGQILSVEAIDVNLNLARTVTFATGALATQRAFVVQAPTYAFVGASTISDTATVAITGAPAVGANATLTRAAALWVQAGQTWHPVGTAALPAVAFKNGAGTVYNTGLWASQSADRLNFSITGVTAVWIADGGTTATRGIFVSDNGTGSTLSTTICQNGMRNNAYQNSPFYVRGHCFDTDTNTDVTLGGNETIGRLAGLIVDVQNGTTSIHSIAWNGNVKMTQQVATLQTVTPLLWMVGAAHTSLTLSTEQIAVKWDLAQTVQFATGALATQRAVFFDTATTYAFVGASTLTYAIGMHVTGNPTQGANATLSASAGFVIGGNAAFAARTITMTSAAGTTFRQIMTIGDTLNVTGGVQMTATASVAAMVLDRITITAGQATVIDSVATLNIKGAPIQGANVTLTKTYSIWVEGGILRYDSGTFTSAGGGAAPTFGTVGGSGPAAAAQSAWIKFEDATGAFFVMAWR